MAAVSDYGMIADSIKQVTPEDYALQKQQLANLALNNSTGSLNNKVAQLKLDQAARESGADKVLRDSLQANTAVDPGTGQVQVNHGQVAADLANSGHADKAYDYINQQHQATYEKHKEALGAIAQAAQGVLAQPEEVRPQAYQSSLAQLKQSGIDITGAPADYDPNYLTGVINTAVDAKTHFEANNKELNMEKQHEYDLERDKLNPKANEKPYHTTFSTADGMFDFDSRSGIAKKILDSTGKPVVKDTADIDLQSGIEKGKTIGKKEGERIDTAAKADNLSGQLLGNIDEARKLLKNATGSLAGAIRDKAAGAVGVTTNAGNAATQLETLGGWMTANVPRMEGPQSNADVENYRTMAGRVGDRTEPVESRLAALDVLERLQKKYSEKNKQIINDSAIPQGGSGKGSMTPGITLGAKPSLNDIFGN